LSEGIFFEIVKLLAHLKLPSSACVLLPIYSEISEKKKKLQGLSHLRKTKWMNSKIKYSIQVYEFECNLTVTLSVVCKDSVILKSVYKTRSQYIRHKKMVKCEKIIST